MNKQQEVIWKLFDKRVSVRSYLPQDVSDESIEFLLECGVTAPSNGNMQPWEFIIIRDDEVKNRVVECTFTGYFSKGSNHQNWILDAPVVLVVCANQKRTKARYGEMGILGSIIDTAAAIENILLAASGIGLASCWVGGFNEQKLKQILKIPDQVKPIGLLPIGYPGEEVERKNRLSTTILKHYNYFHNEKRKEVDENANQA